MMNLWFVLSVLMVGRHGYQVSAKVTGNYADFNQTTSMPSSLKCSCNTDSSETPCNAYGDVFMCEFIYTTQKRMDDKTGLYVVDHATCVAAKRPKTGDIYYSCGWGSFANSRVCEVIIGREGIPIDVCRCNNANFCNENFFEDEGSDDDDVDDTDIAVDDRPSDKSVEKIDKSVVEHQMTRIETQPTPSLVLVSTTTKEAIAVDPARNLVERAQLSSTRSTTNKYLNNDLIEISTSSPSTKTSKIEHDSKNCHDCDSSNDLTSINVAVCVNSNSKRIATIIVALTIVSLTFVNFFHRR